MDGDSTRSRVRDQNHRPDPLPPLASYGAYSAGSLPDRQYTHGLRGPAGGVHMSLGFLICQAGTRWTGLALALPG